MKPAILLLTYCYPPDLFSGGARAYRLAKYLGRLGHAVQVLAAGDNLEPVVEDNVQRLRGGRVRGMPLDFSNFAERCLRHTLFVHDAGGTWIPRVLARARGWMRAAHRPVVLSTAPPMTAHAAAWWLNRRQGAPWIADFRDPLAGNPFRSGWRAAICDAVMERAFLRAAQAVIVNTDTVAELWKRRYPQWAGKIHVVWNGFDPEERLAARPLPPRAYKVLAHVGSIYGERDPQWLLEAVQRLLARGALAAGQLRIRLVGLVQEGWAEAPLWQALKAQGCLEVGEPAPRPEAQRIMAESDFLLLLDVIGEHAGLQVPAKLFEYVQIGRPVVACTASGSPVERILERSGIRYVRLSPDLPAEEIDRRLQAFLGESTAPQAPSAWFEDHFDGRRQAEYISALVTQLGAEPLEAGRAAGTRGQAAGRVIR